MSAGTLSRPARSLPNVYGMTNDRNPASAFVRQQEREAKRARDRAVWECLPHRSSPGARSSEIAERVGLTTQQVAGSLRRLRAAGMAAVGPGENAAGYHMARLFWRNGDREP